MAIVKVNKDRYTVDSLYQFDYNQDLTIYGLSLPSIPEIHFANSVVKEAIVKQATMDNAGIVSVDIPNEILTYPNNIDVYVCIYEGDAFRVLYKFTIPVNPKKKPAEYVLIDEENIHSFNALENKLENTLKLSLENYAEANAKYDETNVKYSNAVDLLNEAVEKNNSATEEYNKGIEYVDNTLESTKEAQSKAEDAQAKAEEAQSKAEEAQTKAENALQTVSDTVEAVETAEAEAIEAIEGVKNNAVESIEDVKQEAIESVETAEAEAIEAVKKSADTVSQADWDQNDDTMLDYVKNRTHYKEVLSEEGTLLEETTISFTTSMIGVSGIGTSNVNEGGEYTVYWNGTAYECKPVKKGSTLHLGNASLTTSLEDTGEPFDIELLSETGALITKSTSTAESVTIKIESKEVVVYHKLDSKYIKDMYYTEEGDETEILSETTVTLTDSQGVIDTTLNLEEGKTYKVLWNGVEYECVAQVMTSEGVARALGLGDVGTLTGGTSTGEPFIVVMVYPEYVETIGVASAVYCIDGSESATLKIIGKTITIHKIPSKYLPETESVIITIADDGTISANVSLSSMKDISDAELRSRLTVNYESSPYPLTVLGVDKLETEDVVVFTIMVKSYSDTFMGIIDYVTWAYYNSVGTDALSFAGLGYNAQFVTIPTGSKAGMLVMYQSNGTVYPSFPTELIMKASDNNSKLMKLTVSSDGSITATEYTA